MDDKDVISVLRMLGLFQKAEKEQYSRDELIPRLMNVTLHCLGALRSLVIEQEQIRISKDSNDIDNTCRDDGLPSLFLREIFRGAVQTLTSAIVTGVEIEKHDPSKDLVESFPCNYLLRQPEWLMLNWTILRDGKPPQTKEEEEFYVDSTTKALEYFPRSANEIDKVGQTYMAYVFRSNCVSLVELMLKRDTRIVNMKDGTGRQLVHYCAAHAQKVELLYCIVEASGKSMNVLMSTSLDGDGNLPLHTAAGGCCSTSVLKEILFAYPDAIKLTNKEGKLPLHISACNNNVDNLNSLFAAYPHGAGCPDNNGWLPMQHAAYTCNSIDVVRYLHENYPNSINRPHKSGRLPLHYAAASCIDSKVFSYLLDIYPQAASIFDINRRLPLHNLIARCQYMTPARLRCMRSLLAVYPHAASMAGSDGRTPLAIARRDGHGDMVSKVVIIIY